MSANTTAQSIGTAIAAARKAALLTQEELAALCGVSDRTIRNIENGTGGSALATVLVVAQAVGVTITAKRGGK